MACSGGLGDRERSAIDPPDHQVRALHQPGAGSRPEAPEGAIASLNTHDIPTFTAMWEGLDIADRLQLGLIDENGAEEDRRDREDLRRALTAGLRRRGVLGGETDGHSVMRAAQRYLASSSARMMLVNLEDLWDERRPQNVPGTGTERPNWIRRC